VPFSLDAIMFAALSFTFNDWPVQPITPGTSVQHGGVFPFSLQFAIAG
jgi:hypothetical protein